MMTSLTNRAVLSPFIEQSMAYAICIYVEQQPVTGITISHVTRWPHFDVLRKTPTQFFLMQIYNRFIFCVCVKTVKILNIRIIFLVV